MTGDRHARFRRDYAPVFLQYLSQRGEPGLRAAYEFGRRAMLEELSMLDLAQIHHAALFEVLKTLRAPEELELVSQGASEFLVEVLATFEMTQRGFAELQQASTAREEQARQLRDGLEQQLVTEQATGMIMERRNLAPHAALEWLRATAARQHLTVEELAIRLVRRQPLRPGRSG
jgi:hypothetical protein